VIVEDDAELDPDYTKGLIDGVIEGIHESDTTAAKDVNAKSRKRKRL
jgi:hypothetical protein